MPYSLSNIGTIYVNQVFSWKDQEDAIKTQMEKEQPTTSWRLRKASSYTSGSDRIQLLFKGAQDQTSSEGPSALIAATQLTDTEIAKLKAGTYELGTFESMKYFVAKVIDASGKETYMKINTRSFFERLGLSWQERTQLHEVITKKENPDTISAQIHQAQIKHSFAAAETAAKAKQAVPASSPQAKEEVLPTKIPTPPSPLAHSADNSDAVAQVIPEPVAVPNDGSATLKSEADHEPHAHEQSTPAPTTPKALETLVSQKPPASPRLAAETPKGIFDIEDSKPKTDDEALAHEDLTSAELTSAAVTREQPASPKALETLVSQTPPAFPHLAPLHIEEGEEMLQVLSDAPESQANDTSTHEEFINEELINEEPAHDQLTHEQPARTHEQQANALASPKTPQTPGSQTPPNSPRSPVSSAPSTPTSRSSFSSTPSTPTSPLSSASSSASSTPTSPRSPVSSTPSTPTSPHSPVSSTPSTPTTPRSPASTLQTPPKTRPRSHSTPDLRTSPTNKIPQSVKSPIAALASPVNVIAAPSPTPVTAQDSDLLTHSDVPPLASELLPQEPTVQEEAPHKPVEEATSFVSPQLPEEVVQEDIVQEDIVQEDIVQEEMVHEDIVHEDIVHEAIAQKEIEEMPASPTRILSEEVTQQALDESQVVSDSTAVVPYEEQSDDDEDDDALSGLQTPRGSNASISPFEEALSIPEDKVVIAEENGKSMIEDPSAAITVSPAASQKEEEPQSTSNQAIPPAPPQDLSSVVEPQQPKHTALIVAPDDRIIPYHDSGAAAQPREPQALSANPDEVIPLEDHFSLKNELTTSHPPADDQPADIQQVQEEPSHLIEVDEKDKRAEKKEEQGSAVAAAVPVEEEQGSAVAVAIPVEEELAAPVKPVVDTPSAEPISALIAPDDLGELPSAEEIMNSFNTRLKDLQNANLTTFAELTADLLMATTKEELEPDLNRFIGLIQDNVAIYKDDPSFITEIEEQLEQLKKLAKQEAFNTADIEALADSVWQEVAFLNETTGTELSSKLSASLEVGLKDEETFTNIKNYIRHLTLSSDPAKEGDAEIEIHLAKAARYIELEDQKLFANDEPVQGPVKDSLVDTGSIADTKQAPGTPNKTQATSQSPSRLVRLKPSRQRVKALAISTLALAALTALTAVTGGYIKRRLDPTQANDTSLPNIDDAVAFTGTVLTVAGNIGGHVATLATVATTVATTALTNIPEVTKNALVSLNNWGDYAIYKLTNRVPASIEIPEEEAPKIPDDLPDVEDDYDEDEIDEDEIDVNATSTHSSSTNQTKPKVEWIDDEIDHNEVANFTPDTITKLPNTASGVDKVTRTGIANVTIDTLSVEHAQQLFRTYGPANFTSAQLQQALDPELFGNDLNVTAIFQDMTSEQRKLFDYTKLNEDQVHQFSTEQIAASPLLDIVSRLSVLQTQSLTEEQVKTVFKAQGLLESLSHIQQVILGNQWASLLSDKQAAYLISTGIMNATSKANLSESQVQGIATLLQADQFISALYKQNTYATLRIEEEQEQLKIKAKQEAADRVRTETLTTSVQKFVTDPTTFSKEDIKAIMKRDPNKALLAFDEALKGERDKNIQKNNNFLGRFRSTRTNEQFNTSYLNHMKFIFNRMTVKQIQALNQETMNQLDVAHIAHIFNLMSTEQIQTLPQQTFTLLIKEHPGSIDVKKLKPPVLAKLFDPAFINKEIASLARYLDPDQVMKLTEDNVNQIIKLASSQTAEQIRRLRQSNSTLKDDQAKTS